MIVKIIVLLVLVTSSCRGENFLNTEISSRSGLYYESVGDVRFTTGEWQIVTYIDLRKFIDHRPLIHSKILENMTQKCKHYGEAEQCTKVLQSENILKQNRNVEKYINQFLFFTNESSTEEQNKNVTLEIIEKTLDNEKTLNKTSKKLHIIESGLHHFFDTIKALENQSTISLRDVETEARLIEELMKNETFNSAGYQRMLNKIRDWTESLEEELDNYISTLKTIIDIVHLAETGVVHPELFTLEELQSAINYFSTINRDASVTLPPDELLKISKTKIGFHEGKLIIILKIPLVTSSVYQLFKMYPLPALQLFGHKRGSAYIQPRVNYLLLGQDFYTLAQAEDLAHCAVTNDYRFLCEPKYPFYDINTHPICEAMIFEKDNLLTSLFGNCPIKVSSIYNSHWKKTQKGWLYSVPQSEKVNIWCEGQWINAINVSGAGILQLKKRCQASTSSITMPGFQEHVKKPDEEIFGWNLNVTTLIYKRKCFHYLPNYYVQLEEILHECDGHAQDHKFHGMLFALMSIGLGVVCLGLLAFIPWTTPLSTINIIRWRESDV